MFNHRKKIVSENPIFSFKQGMLKLVSTTIIYDM